VNDEPFSSVTYSRQPFVERFLLELGGISRSSVGSGGCGGAGQTLQRRVTARIGRHRRDRRRRPLARRQTGVPAGERRGAGARRHLVAMTAGVARRQRPDGSATIRTAAFATGPYASTT